LVDLDGDGHLDLISGSWPGEIFVFRGGPGHTFRPPDMLKDKNGQIINIGGGIEERPDGILITGHGEFEQTSEGTFVNYHGKRIKSTPEKQIGISGTASAVHAVDWDGDGVIDLLVGDIGGNVWLVPNEGTRTKYAFGKQRQLMAGGKPLRVDGGDAGPFAADWDGDGKLDLLVGAGDGSVWFYRNIGTTRAPKLAAGVQLIGPGEANFGADAPWEARRGIRAKVCAVDFNGDGRLDLIVGDFTTQKPDRPAPTAAEKVEQDRARKELTSARERYHELTGKLYGAARVKDKKERKKLDKELQTITDKMMQLQKKVPPEYENHGWVWLFLRKPAADKAGLR
jgi:hypothetical protein